jgi:lysylphosphatidylglycerol synthetase-like protein (DUF2156 family)
MVSLGCLIYCGCLSSKVISSVKWHLVLFGESVSTTPSHDQQRTPAEPEPWIAESISAGKAKCVRDLLAIRDSRKSRLTDSELVEIVRRMKESGQITFSKRPPKFKSFFSFLLNLPWCWTFWFLLATTAVTLGSVYYLPSSIPWTYVRWIAGIVLLGFAPGLGLVRLLFGSRRELDEAETVSLSIGLSLVVSTLVGILLNFSPRGISLGSIVFAMATLVVFFACASAARDYVFLSGLSK